MSIIVRCIYTSQWDIYAEVLDSLYILPVLSLSNIRFVRSLVYVSLDIFFLLSFFRLILPNKYSYIPLRFYSLVSFVGFSVFFFFLILFFLFPLFFPFNFHFLSPP